MVLTKRPLLVEYIISYLSFAILTCLLIGAVMYVIALQNITAMAKKNTQYKLELAIRDVENQMDILRGIALDVSTKMIYKPFYFRRNKYYEIEMLEQLSRFTSYSIYSEQYFVYYRGDKLIYRSKNAAASLSVALQELGLTQPVFERLTNQANGEQIHIQDSQVLIFLPVHTTGKSDQTGDATLCFIIEQARVDKRIQDVTGGITGALTLLFQEQILTGPDVLPEHADISLHAQAGLFSLLLNASNEQILNQFERFSRVNLALIVLSVMMMAVVSVIVGYTKYRPIRKLVSKYIMNQSGQAVNELFGLDWTLQQYSEKEIQYTKRIAEQMQLLRNQSLKLLLTGNYTDDLGKRLSLFGVGLPGPYYSVITIDCALSDLDRVQVLIEDLSDATLSFYGLQSENHLALVVSMNDDSRYQEIDELVDAVLSAADISCRLSAHDASMITQDLAELHRSYRRTCLEMLKNQSNHERAENRQTFTRQADGEHAKDSQKRSDSALAQTIIAYIQENYQQYDMSLEKLSGLYNVSTGYLSRLIKLETGENYISFLTRLRIELARHLLQDQNLTVSDTCDKIGYSNISHFIKTFKSVTGMTPARYRRFAINE